MHFSGVETHRSAGTAGACGGRARAHAGCGTGKWWFTDLPIYQRPVPGRAGVRTGARTARRSDTAFPGAASRRLHGRLRGSITVAPRPAPGQPALLRPGPPAPLRPLPAPAAGGPAPPRPARLYGPGPRPLALRRGTARGTVRATDRQRRRGGRARAMVAAAGSALLAALLAAGLAAAGRWAGRGREGPGQGSPAAGGSGAAPLLPAAPRGSGAPSGRGVCAGPSLTRDSRSALAAAGPGPWCWTAPARWVRSLQRACEPLPRGAHTGAGDASSGKSGSLNCGPDGAVAAPPVGRWEHPQFLVCQGLSLHQQPVITGVGFYGGRYLTRFWERINKITYCRPSHSSVPSPRSPEAEVLQQGNGS